jgi:hypothetical protein
MKQAAGFFDHGMWAHFVQNHNSLHLKRFIATEKLNSNDELKSVEK